MIIKKFKGKKSFPLQEVFCGGKSKFRQAPSGSGRNIIQ
jgi:hypothetical protein